MSDEHNRENGKKSKNPIDVKQKTIDMLMYSIDYIKSLTEYIRYESLVKQEKEQEVNCVKSASQASKLSNDQNTKETKKLIKNKRHRELIKPSSKTRTKNKEKETRKYTLKKNQNKNHDLHKENFKNGEGRAKFIKQIETLNNSKDGRIVKSLVIPKLVNNDDAKSWAQTEIHKVDSLSLKIPEMVEKSNGKHSQISNVAYIDI